MTSDAVQLALDSIAPWIGMSGRDKDRQRAAAWAAILLPHDDPARALDYLKSVGARIPTSSCALVVCRYFSRIGCTCKEHTIPYLPRMGQAVADVERVARRHGAWLTSAEDLGTVAEPGDVLCIRKASPHVLIVESADGRGHILSIDGGQGDNTFTLRRERRATATGSGADLLDLADGVSPSGGRVSSVYARVSGQRIAETPELCR